MTTIYFNGKSFDIPEAALSVASGALRQHLSSVMNGTGATINFGGTAYSIDSTKLSTATNTFVSHLGTIAGNGSKVVVNGIECSIDSAKMSGAIAEIHATLGALQSEDNGGQGGTGREDYMPYYGEQYVVADYDSQGNIDGEIIYILYEDGSVSQAYYVDGVLQGDEVVFPAGTVTCVGGEVFMNGALFGEEGWVLYATISKDGTQLTFIDDGMVATLKSSLTFPIYWNTKKVANNYSFTMMDLPLVKVSSELPTTEELQKAYVKFTDADGIRHNLVFRSFINLDAGDDIVRAQYDEGSSSSAFPVFVVYKEGTYLGVEVLETGLYTLNTGLILNLDMDMVFNVQ